MHLIDFTVGDWSDDGHGESESRMYWSNIPVQDIRELHFSTPAVLGFDIGDMNHRYSDCQLNFKYLEPLLVSTRGRALLKATTFGKDRYDDIINSLTIESQESLTSSHIGDRFVEVRLLPEETCMTPEYVLDIWACLLQLMDSSLKLVDANAIADQIMPVLDDAGVKLVRDLMKHAPNGSTEYQLAEAVLSYTEAPVESVHFYGVDKQNRHLQVPGYGTF